IVQKKQSLLRFRFDCCIGQIPFQSQKYYYLTRFYTPCSGEGEGCLRRNQLFQSHFSFLFVTLLVPLLLQRTRMLGKVEILFGLLGGEMRRRGLVKCSNLQVQLFVSPRSSRAS
ncbi:MAG: hypothetical protein EZS28_055881, partial [Streblomastix strix]